MDSSQYRRKLLEKRKMEDLDRQGRQFYTDSKNRRQPESQPSLSSIIIFNIQEPVADIKKNFSSAGIVVHARYVRDNVAEVVYSNTREADRAVSTFDTMLLKGRRLVVIKGSSSSSCFKGPDNLMQHAVRVCNIESSVSMESIKKNFGCIGGLIEGIFVDKNVAVLVYEEKEKAEKAIYEFDGLKVDGKALQVGHMPLLALKLKLEAYEQQQESLPVVDLIPSVQVPPKSSKPLDHRKSLWSSLTSSDATTLFERPDNSWGRSVKSSLKDFPKTLHPAAQKESDRWVYAAETMKTFTDLALSVKKESLFGRRSCKGQTFGDKSVSTDWRMPCDPTQKNEAVNPPPNCSKKRRLKMPFVIEYGKKQHLEAMDFVTENVCRVSLSRDNDRVGAVEQLNKQQSQSKFTDNDRLLAAERLRRQDSWNAGQFRLNRTEMNTDRRVHSPKVSGKQDRHVFSADERRIACGKFSKEEVGNKFPNDERRFMKPEKFNTELMPESFSRQDRNDFNDGERSTKIPGKFNREEVVNRFLGGEGNVKLSGNLSREDRNTFPHEDRSMMLDRKFSRKEDEKRFSHDEKIMMVHGQFSREDDRNRFPMDERNRMMPEKFSSEGVSNRLYGDERSMMIPGKFSIEDRNSFPGDEKSLMMSRKFSREDRDKFPEDERSMIPEKLCREEYPNRFPNDERSMMLTRKFSREDRKRFPDDERSMLMHGTFSRENRNRFSDDERSMMMHGTFSREDRNRFLDDKRNMIVPGKFNREDTNRFPDDEKRMVMPGQLSTEDRNKFPDDKRSMSIPGKFNREGGNRFPEDERNIIPGKSSREGRNRFSDDERSMMITGKFNREENLNKFSGNERMMTGKSSREDQSKFFEENTRVEHGDFNRQKDRNGFPDPNRIVTDASSSDKGRNRSKNHARRVAFEQPGRNEDRNRFVDDKTTASAKQNVLFVKGNDLRVNLSQQEDGGYKNIAPSSWTDSVAPERSLKIKIEAGGGKCYRIFTRDDNVQYFKRLKTQLNIAVTANLTDDGTCVLEITGTKTSIRRKKRLVFQWLKDAGFVDYKLIFNEIASSTVSATDNV